VWCVSGCNSSNTSGPCLNCQAFGNSHGPYINCAP
jgi:hypothetical protein